MDKQIDTELEFIEKPLKKPDEKILGRLEKWNDTGFQQFVPVAHGTGTKKIVMGSANKAKLVKNEGEKESSYSLYCSCNASVEDFADKLLEDTAKVLKPHLKKDFRLPNAKFIRNEETLKVWKSRERKKLCFYVELDEQKDKALLSKDWSTVSYEISKILYSIKK